MNKVCVSSFPDLYEFIIPEDLPIGKMGGKVKANDRDTGENSKSTYGIVEGDDQGVFEIVADSQTQEGILQLKKVRSKWPGPSCSRWTDALLARRCGLGKCPLFPSATTIGFI